MATGKAVIKNETGLHTRPGNEFIKYVKGLAGVTVEVEKAGKRIKATSLLQIMSLGVKKGDELIVYVEGDNADTVLQEIIVFLETLKD
ncbi:MAG: HPr family phosphocarrier protein [Brevinema sp.]